MRSWIPCSARICAYVRFLPRTTDLQRCIPLSLWTLPLRTHDYRMSTAPSGYMNSPPMHVPARARVALRLTILPTTRGLTVLFNYSLVTVDGWFTPSCVIKPLLNSRSQLSSFLLLDLYTPSLCLVSSLTLDAPRRSRPLDTAPMTLTMVNRTTGTATTVLIMNLSYRRGGLPGARCYRRAQVRARTPRTQVPGLVEGCVRVASTLYTY